MSKTRDFQRARVYAWERAELGPFPVTSSHFVRKAAGGGYRRKYRMETNGHKILTLAECKELVEKVWAKLRPGRLPPEVLDGRGRRSACGCRQYIKLPWWSRVRSVVLHETAHSLTTTGHGPEFLACYLELLARWDGRSRRELRSSARAARIKIARAGA